MSSGTRDHEMTETSCDSGTCGCGGADPVVDPGTSRRDFLKVVGAAGAGVAATAACGPPNTGDKLIAHLVTPENITPGANSTYATLLTGAGPEALGLHAWVRDGRPIKLEGNPAFPTNRGRLTALAQSALQDLYDPDRVQQPQRRAGDGFQPIAWDEAVANAGGAVGSGGTVLLTSPVTGSRARLYAEWASAVGAEHVQYEPFNYAVQRQANEIAFGVRDIPAYDIDGADFILSFGAEFLETWLAPTDLSRRYAASREFEAGRQAEFAFVGPRLSLTGTNADHWIPARAGTETLVALAIARAVAERRGVAPRLSELLAPYAPDAVADQVGVPADRIQALAEKVASARSPIALPPGVAGQGAAATDAHVAVALLNWVAGAVGQTVRFGAGPHRAESASFTEMAQLIGRMRSGGVSTLVVAGVNPVYSLPAASGFADALGQVATVISLGSHLDETSEAAGWVLPSHHELESWGDAEIGDGARGLGQPLLAPLFDTRQVEDILIQLAVAARPGTDFGAPDFAGYLQNRWRELHAAGDGILGFESWWVERMKAGGLYDQSPAPTTPVSLATGSLGYSFSAPDRDAGESLSLVAYPTVQFYDGRGANRPWMQEMPDPVVKTVWNSWVELHPDTAAARGLEHGDIVEVRSESGSVSAPVFLYRGIREDCVGMPLGQGHSAYGRFASGRGVNPLQVLPASTDARSGALAFAGTAVEITATGERGLLVNTQGSDSDHDRHIATMIGIDLARAELREHHVEPGQVMDTAFDSDPNSPYRWGMTIDLNLCTGCGACTEACSAENNIPWVGEERVEQGREMSWISVARYFKETADGGFRTLHAPMLCQHCGDAPCEPVCPVYATYHNPEGLNAQVYNRCVGTRYCANNCPYKVRRFNWYTYPIGENGEDKQFGDWPYPLDLQLNPDVTVRSKGVMEKCTFCVQRINRAKYLAKDQDRQIADGEVVSACMQTCPTEAIVFGNLKDPESRVSQIALGARGYHALDELSTRPAVTYLKGVTHAELAEGDDHGGGQGGDHGGDDHGEEDGSENAESHG